MPRILLTCAYLALVAAAAVSALYLWHSHCEGFGCTGLGIAWAAWACFVHLPALVMGHVVRARPPAPRWLAGSAAWALGAHWALGALLATYWIAKQAG